MNKEEKSRLVKESLKDPFTKTVALASFAAIPVAFTHYLSMEHIETYRTFIENLMRYIK